MADATKLAKAKYTPEQAVAVVTAKHREWGKDPEMAKNLRPSTLLRPSNFGRYVADLPAEGELEGDGSGFTDADYSREPTPEEEAELRQMAKAQGFEYEELYGVQ